MKFLLLFLFVAVALADQESETSQEIVARSLARIFRIDPMDSLECVRKSEVTIEDLQYADIGLEFNDAEVTDLKSLRRASCAMTCCGQKRGYLVGGVVQVDELFRMFQETGIPEDIEKQLRDVARICKEQVTDTSDECMAGYKFMKCLYQRGRRIVQHE